MMEKSQTSRVTTVISTQHKLPASDNSIGGISTDVLEAIREERSPTASATQATIDDLRKPFKCVCRKLDGAGKNQRQEDIERLLKEKELELRTEYDKILENEMAAMKERFNYILSNEQIRASYMLREAHRERQEKITALQSQLECKNLAALMYVMCTERRRSKIEKLTIVRDYTKYIHELQDILTEGQELILHLSRGYKTAARVDHEWREKMKKVISEFMGFIYNFAGGSPETNQYFFDMQALLKTEAPIQDNPNEDPCENEEVVEETPDMEIPREKTWWEQLDDERRPFVMFGDMADFTPDERRNTLQHLKAPKTAPKKWKTYVFNEMFLNTSCKNLDDIKDIYPQKVLEPSHWECQTSPTQTEQRRSSKMSLASRQYQSVDFHGTMGSLLKIVTPAKTIQSTTKTALLGARDSMEIASTTKLARISIRPPPPPEPIDLEVEVECEAPTVIEQHGVLAIGRRRTFDQGLPAEEEEMPKPPPQHKADDDEEEKVSLHSNGHTDSLQVIPMHVPDNDHAIYYERVCPTKKCKLMQVDSFMRSLPAYMRTSPFTHFEHTYDGYETCTPEQLQILKQRIESKKAKALEDAEVGEENPLSEWIGQGVAVQTSDMSMSLPPCTCHVPSPTPVSSNFVFNLEDLMPVKQAMDAIHKECLYDDRIDFDRFKVIGSESRTTQQRSNNEYRPVKYDEIKKILMENPSLLDVFHPESGTPGMI